MCDNLPPFQKPKKKKTKTVNSIQEISPIECSNKFDSLYTTEESESLNTDSITSSSSDSSSEDENDFTNMKVKTRQKRNKKVTSKGIIKTTKRRATNTEPKQQHWKPKQHKPPYHTVSQLYSDVVQQNPQDIVIFSDSMIKNIRMGEFNSYIRNGEAHLKAYPGADSEKLYNKVSEDLQQQKYDMAAVHVGINDILNRSNDLINRSKVNEALNEICGDIVNIGLKCRNFNVTTIFISGIIYSGQIDSRVINELNGMLQAQCQEYGFVFIDNRAVSKSNLWTDGIHMNDNGKKIVANNFIRHINRFLSMVNHPFRMV